MRGIKHLVRRECGEKETQIAVIMFVAPDRVKGPADRPT